MLHTMGGGLKKTILPHYQTLSQMMKDLILWKSAYQVIEKRDCSERRQMQHSAGF